MIDNLRATQQGKSIAIAGSGPSVLDYDIHAQDILIGVNGAGNLLKKGDIFFSADERSYMRSWFEDLDADITAIVRGQSAIYSERHYPDASLRKELISGYEKSRDKIPEVIQILDHGYKHVVPGANPFLDAFLESLPDCEPPNLLIRRLVQGEPISKQQHALNFGGTGACVALQLADVMGAKEVHLYGIEFSNNIKGEKLYSGKNYFYKPKQGESGMTLPKQKQFMDNIILYMREKQNLPVYSHGPTALENTIKA